jgi:hypothetical protein
MRKYVVSLDEGHARVVEKDLLGKMGDTPSAALRNIVVAWLGEHGYLDRRPKQ